MSRLVHKSAVEFTFPLFRRKRKRSNTGSRSSAELKSFSIVGRRYSAGSSRQFSPFFSDRFERRGLVYVGADINNPAQMQATNGSGYWQSHGCVPAQGSGRGYTSENARFEDTHFQSGTDLVGADWEPTLSVANGQPVSQTDALNNTTSYTYNSYGKVLTVTDAESNVTSYTYNLLGQMTSLTDPEGNATSWTYDSMGRVVSETNEKNAVRYYQYDDLGRLIQTTDRNGRVIQYEYDYLGRQTAEKWLDSNSAVIGSILYTFDGNNNLLTVTDSISGTNYEYRYDALNRCFYTCIDAAELNSPVYLSYLYSNSDLTVTETLTGLINGVVAPYYQNVYQYDVFGRLESISQTGTGLTAKSVDYVYNLNGQRISAEYQQNGDTVSESAWVYDVAGKVSSIQHKTALDAVFAEYDFTWDAGNRITEFETVDGTAEYTYDKTGQLTGADYDYITDELYTYDSNGNRTNAGYVTGENNETLSDGVYRYSYDNEGNRIEKFLWTDSNNDGIIDASEKTLFQTYEWDYRNRLESVTNYENGIAKEVMDYLYDYLNLMIERTVTDAATSILQSSEYNLYSNGQVALEYDTTSSVDVVKSINLWGANIDELVAVEKIAQSVNDNNVILYSYSDHLNSIRDVLTYDSISQTAAVVNHLIYNAFGILVSSTNAAANPTTISPLLNYRYTGKFFDDSTRLQNNINRWYDNTTGKWISVDPIGFNGGDVNLYRYCQNSSINEMDIFGFQSNNSNCCSSALEAIAEQLSILDNICTILMNQSEKFFKISFELLAYEKIWTYKNQINANENWTNDIWTLLGWEGLVNGILSGVASQIDKQSIERISFPVQRDSSGRFAKRTEEFLKKAEAHSKALAKLKIAPTILLPVGIMSNAFAKFFDIISTANLADSLMKTQTEVLNMAKFIEKDYKSMFDEYVNAIRMADWLHRQDFSGSNGKKACEILTRKIKERNQELNKIFSNLRQRVKRELEIIEQANEVLQMLRDLTSN